ncbi:uncharacterized protein [Rhodnius prolixus]|uniref:uncharacterized protein n=1 Tax=Rhodnius prolixus TaxID=13249 RepID=UPI003D187C41
MGIRPSSLSKPKLPLTWVLKTDSSKQKENCVKKVGETPAQTRPREPSVGGNSSEGKRCRSRHRRSRTPRHQPRGQRFGYQITDIDAFLTKASIETPGNIPVVLSAPCLLYQTQSGGQQEEVSLPLGMVVNAVFKNQSWLYVQTPHGEEGYVRYASCLPLGILPPRPGRDASTPCWESHSDVFPKPTGRSKSDRGYGTRSECGSRAGESCMRGGGRSSCGEETVDSLYLAAAQQARQGRTNRQVLLVVGADYYGKGHNTLSVSKGDVVSLVSSHLRDWFWVKNRDGQEGFIPAVVAGHGFL